jgi:prepilin-type N-terminal cleavage/methylation domain-containing protein
MKIFIVKRRNSMNKHSQGFTIVEIMIVIAIIGIVSTLIVSIGPQYIQSAKQKATIRDMKSISDACMMYISQHGEAPALGIQNGILEAGNEFVKALVPSFMVVLPTSDRWKNPFYVYTGKSCVGVAGLAENLIGDLDFVIVSYGKDGVQEDFFYNPNDSEAGYYEVKDMEDYNMDLIMWNVNFIRQPAIK